MKTIRTALLGTALLAALPAMAQPAPPAAPLVPGAGPRQAPPGHGPMGRTRGPAAMFAVVDANGDGRVVIDEVWTFTQARFADADRNHDGALVLEEALALRL
ncbi:MAG: h, partial [Belnapia sp.]|nr:h [Belnapia sp.]